MIALRLPACTIDTSCVIALEHLDLIPMLGFLFAKVLLPTRVQEELKKEPTTRKRLRIHLRDLAFLEKCRQYDESSVRLLLIENEKRFYKDRGEAEAIVQATELGASVLMDERWGRRIAQIHRLDTRGTLWVLRTLFDLEILASEAVQAGLDRLLSRGIRLPSVAVAQLRRHVLFAD